MSMMPDDGRGKIRYPNRYKQFVDWSGVRVGNITPTDIDGFFEYHDEAFLFYELKLEGAPFEYGQKTAFMRLVDSLVESKRYAVLFYCEHSVHDASKTIYAADSVVMEIYLGEKHGWIKRGDITAAQATGMFMEYVREHCKKSA